MINDVLVLKKLMQIFAKFRIINISLEIYFCVVRIVNLHKFNKTMQNSCFKDDEDQKP